ncbi:hypothetical protein [Corynebacterium sp. HMSC034A01]|uniref:Rv3212 family protein n=1 Tax=Corynebacterium sp. HMSC034A01 TaxID=1739295 RepID=UPI0008A919A7|nr:hypothetical protein [Corynebacterium sp. HMSC034A01]OHR21972.1 hypothetical protein HMPREF2791_06695 [Corynebacterium sp. HMSC034A01]
MNAPLRRTRGDLIATGVIAGVSALLLGTAFFTAPARDAHLSAAEEEQQDYGQLAVVPKSFSEGFSLTDTSGRDQPLVASGMVITYNDNTLTATTPEGETVWTYERPNELCLVDQAWGKVVATYRDNAGCGDVVAIDAKTGKYAGTRSAIAPENVVRLASNDRVGYASSERAEVWRSDLVRTVEYGHVEAKQEPDMQPNECTITSALTRTELVAVTEICDDGAFLRLQEATPEDSRKPEVLANVEISPDAYLVSISQDAAAVYDPTTSEVRGYNTEGTNISSSSVPQMDSPELGPDGIVKNLPVADLPHHMTYWENNSLLLMEPSALAVTGVFQGALGTGFSAGEKLLYASDSGIAVVDWDKNAVDKIIPVDRGGYSGPVYISSAGATVVEKRGDEVVVMKANT